VFAHRYEKFLNHEMGLLSHSWLSYCTIRRVGYYRFPRKNSSDLICWLSYPANRAGVELHQLRKVKSDPETKCQTGRLGMTRDELRTQNFVKTTQNTRECECHF